MNKFRTRRITNASPSVTLFFFRALDYVSCVYRTRRGFPGNSIISSAKQCIRGKSGHPVCWPKAF